MFDNQIIALVIKTIIDQEAGAGLPDMPIAQAFQPTQQGVSSAPTAYLHKVGDHRLGSPYRGDVYDPVKKVMVHTELQQYETTFQMNALSTQDPANVQQLTASDLLNLIAAILQSTATIQILNANGLGILRVTDVRNPAFTDDRDRNEYAPSFDFVIQHKQIVTTPGVVIESIQFDIVTI